MTKQVPYLDPCGRQLMLFVCPVCRAPFSGTSRRVFCSPKCRLNAFRAAHRQRAAGAAAPAGKKGAA